MQIEAQQHAADLQQIQNEKPSLESHPHQSHLLFCLFVYLTFTSSVLILAPLLSLFRSGVSHRLLHFSELTCACLVMAGESSKGPRSDRVRLEEQMRTC